ncbi:TetR/AcrR family transcriptional regulator [Amycolatopsis sp. NPDC059657]|uniref:TetR/AcrR family transcriptional regulator n=1 Tax=Amycolatopsis sp. NPDC059657 TaxID=3346899 RepID=UPI00366AF02A
MVTVAKPALRADARRNRARVLEAAEEVFAAEGLGVPLDEIARRAGVGAGTVYRHFPSKEALFQAVILERIEQFAQEAHDLLGSPDPGGAFFGYLQRVIDQCARNKALCDALAESTGLGFKTEADGELQGALGDLLARAQAAGAVRADIDVAGLRALIVGCLAMDRYAGGAGPSKVVFDGLKA